MGITGSLILLLIFLVVYIVMIEIFTVLFRLTGLTEEKAKFQVISLLTNCGYTTQESEIIASAPRRRKLAEMTMISGYSFAVIIVSSIVNIFFTLHGSAFNNILFALLICGGLSILILLVMKTGI